MEGDRTHWATELQYRKDWFHQAMHDKNVMQEQMVKCATALIENESKLRVHLQGDESRPQSMDDSREESNRSSLQNLMDLKAQVAILKAGIGSSYTF